MKIKRFKYLKEKGITDSAMFDIVKYTVIPSLNISFDEVIVNTILLVPSRKQFRYPTWEQYLNVLIQKYGISKNTVEEAVKKGVYKCKEEIQKSIEKFMVKYRKMISENQSKSN